MRIALLLGFFLSLRRNNSRDNEAITVYNFLNVRICLVFQLCHYAKWQWNGKQQFTLSAMLSVYRYLAKKKEKKQLQRPKIIPTSTIFINKIWHANATCLLLVMIVEARQKQSQIKCVCVKITSTRFVYYMWFYLIRTQDTALMLEFNTMKSRNKTKLLKTIDCAFCVFLLLLFWCCVSTLQSFVVYLQWVSFWFFCLFFVLLRIFQLHKMSDAPLEHLYVHTRTNNNKIIRTHSTSWKMYSKIARPCTDERNKSGKEEYVVHSTADKKNLSNNWQWFDGFLVFAFSLQSNEAQLYAPQCRKFLTPFATIAMINFFLQFRFLFEAHSVWIDSPFCSKRFYTKNEDEPQQTHTEEDMIRCAHSTDNMTIAVCLIFYAVFYTLKPDNFYKSICIPFSKSFS